MDWHFQQGQIWYLIQMQARIPWILMCQSKFTKYYKFHHFLLNLASFLSNKIVKNNNNGGTFHCRSRNLSSTSVHIPVRSNPSKMKRQNFFYKTFDIPIYNFLIAPRKNKHGRVYQKKDRTEVCKFAKTFSQLHS